LPDLQKPAIKGREKKIEKKRKKVSKRFSFLFPPKLKYLKLLSPTKGKEEKDLHRWVTMKSTLCNTCWVVCVFSFFFFFSLFFFLVLGGGWGEGGHAFLLGSKVR